MASALSKLPLWCIVRADGDKAYLTGRGALPIQYCRIGGSLPMMERGLRRALRITNRRYVVATVAAAHRSFWAAPLWCVPPQRQVIDESSGRLTVTLAAALA